MVLDLFLLSLLFQEAVEYAGPLLLLGKPAQVALDTLCLERLLAECVFVSRLRLLALFLVHVLDDVLVQIAKLPVLLPARAL